MNTRSCHRVALAICALSVFVGFTALPAGDASAEIPCNLGVDYDCWYSGTGLILPPAGNYDPNAELDVEKLYWVVPYVPTSYLLDCDNQRLYLPYLRMQNLRGDAGLSYDVYFKHPDGSTTVSSGGNIGNLKPDSSSNGIGRWVQYSPGFTFPATEVPYIQVNAPAGVQWSAKWTSIDTDHMHLSYTTNEMWAPNSQGSYWCPLPPPAPAPAPAPANQKPFGEIVLSIVDGKKYGLFAYAIDPETGASPRMRVGMEGVGFKEYDWNHTWPEMPARSGWGSTQSFVYLAMPPSGTRNVCVDAQDPQSGEWVTIGCRSITVK